MVRIEEAEVFAWFRTLSPSRRVELMHGLLNMCLPLELRFLGTCLESLCQKDYAYLRDCEHRANTEPTLMDPAIARSRLCVHLALLRATNAACANALFRSVLERTSSSTSSTSEDQSLDDEEHLLLLTFAFYHPAFTFEQKDVLGAMLRAAQDKHRRRLVTSVEDCNACRRPVPPNVEDSYVTNDIGSDSNCSRSSTSSGATSLVCSSPVDSVITVTATIPSGVSTANVNASSPSPPPSSLYPVACGESLNVSTSAGSSSVEMPVTTKANAPSTRSPNLTNVPFKAHIKHLELKSTHRRRGDKRLDYRIQVTWGNGEIAEIIKSHQELCNFHQQLLHFLQDDTNVHRQERHVPYFTGPKQMMGNRTEEPTEDSVCRMADYLRQLMVKVPQHMLNTNLVMGFFGASMELLSRNPAVAQDQDTTEVSSNNGGNGQPSSSKHHSHLTGSPFSSPTTVAPPHSLSNILRHTANFSSSSSLSSTSSASSPPPSLTQQENTSRETTVCNSSKVKSDLSPSSPHLKSMMIYNSLHGESQQSSASSRVPLTLPPQQSMTTTVSDGTSIASGTRQPQRRQSPKASYQTRFLADNDEGLNQLFRKDNLKKYWEQLKKKYSIKELLYLTEENLRNEGIASNQAKQILRIFEIVKCQSRNGIRARHPLLETPTTAVSNSNNVQPTSSSPSPPLKLPQTVVQPPCCTVHTCRTQVYMPTAPLEHLVRCSAPVSTSDGNMMVMHSFPPTLPPPRQPVLQMPASFSVICNGVTTEQQQEQQQATTTHDFENLVCHSDVQHKAACDNVTDVSKEVKLRRNCRNESGNAGSASALHGGPRGAKHDEQIRPSTGVVPLQSDIDLVTSSSSLADTFLQSTNIPQVGYGALNLSSPSDEVNHTPSSSVGSNSVRKLSSPFPLQHHQVPPPQVSLPLTGLNVQQQRGHLCQNCPCTRTRATPPPLQTTPTLPYSFMPFPIGGMFSPFQTAGGPTFLSPNSNGFVPTTAMPPPSYQFIQSPDGLVQAELTAANTYTHLPPGISQQGGSSSCQARLPLQQQHQPPTVPGFVSGPTPNVGFHGAHLQSPPPLSGITPSGSCIPVIGLGPPPPPSNANLFQKWSCYNCGQNGHLGSDCPEAAFGEANRAGQFQLSFMPSEKSPEEYD